MSWSLKYNIGIWATIILIVVSYPSQAFSFSSDLLEAEMQDGTVLKVHLPEDWPDEEYSYARRVLDAACTGYQEIVFHQGFNRAGYTFSSPTRLFAYDNDQTIDIYIADVDAPFSVMECIGGMEYEAKVFIPADYRAYRARYNITRPWLELKASLIHEFLHIITYSYNRNMQTSSQGKFSLTSTHWDWYTEGLARYFETLVGYREEFLSPGFCQTQGRIMKVYKGGVNYFLRNPDKPLNQRKYDFALFWQYIHQNYGMNKIEQISAKFREIDPELCTQQEAMQIIAQTLDVPLKNLLRNFSLYVYKHSALPERKEEGFESVADTCVSSSPKSLTDSIGSFGFDFYTIDLRQGIKTIRLKTLIRQKDLNCMVGTHSAFGFNSYPFEFDSLGKIIIDVRNLPEDTKTMIIMLSNPTDQTVSYRLFLN